MVTKNNKIHTKQQQNLHNPKNGCIHLLSNLFSTYKLNKFIRRNIGCKASYQTSTDNFTSVSNNRSTGLHNGFILLLLLSLAAISGYQNYHSVHAQNLQTGISQEVIRLHVIANSDSDEDQALKLTVKGALVDYLTPFLEDTNSITEARAIIKVKQATLQELAEKTLRNNKSYDNVTVTLGQCYFPIKVYGEYTFPSGNYEALRVQIGQAEGKNWWCVMFPPLCFVDETYSIVDNRSKKKLKTLLTQEEYDTLLSKKAPVKVKFKLIEKLKKLFH